MKKRYLALLLTLIFAAGSVMADVVTTTRKRRVEPQTQQIKKTPSTQYRRTQQKSKTPEDKLSEHIRMCKPYREVMDSDFMGVNFNFHMSIDGWVNNKCRINFAAQSTGISESFKQIHGMDASQAQIFTFEPKIRCEFTRQQLVSIGDSILQENERNAGATNNMLKDPSSIEFSPENFQASDIGLMNAIMNEGACTILNAPDSNQMFQQLFGY